MSVNHTCCSSEPPNLGQSVNALETIDQQMDFLRNVPLSQHVLQLGNRPESPFSERLDKSFVHKSLDENVLLSKHVSSQHFNHFRMAFSTPEFNFDHTSRHVQGMVLLEAIRQAGIASCHLAGLNLQGSISLGGIYTRFARFMVPEVEAIVRAFLPNPSLAQVTKGGQRMHVYIQIFQSTHVCVDAHVDGHVFGDKRVLERVERLAARAR